MGSTTGPKEWRWRPATPTGWWTGSSPWPLFVVAVVAPVAVALVLIPWRGRLDTADNALFLVVVIVAVASTGRRMAAFVSAVAAALSFDFFLTRPYNSFRISGHQDLITEVLLLVVGVAVGELAARGRSHRRDAIESRQTVALLHSVGEQAATGEEPRSVIRMALGELSEQLFLRDCSFTRHDPGNRSARITPDGEVSIAGQRWSTEDLGLPTSRVDLPVRAQGWLLGHFILTPTPGHPVNRHRLLAAVAVADLVGSVLLADESELASVGPWGPDAGSARHHDAPDGGSV